MSGRPFYINILHKFSQLLHPALCLSCGIPVNAKAFICSDCLEAMEIVHNPCSLCGLPNSEPDSICPSCLHNPPVWNALTSPLIYRGYSRKCIHDLKFNEQMYIANVLVKHFHSRFESHKIEVLLPVPLHVTRLLERGYNQADEIANALSLQLNIPVDRKSLTRIKETEAQAGLSLNKRKNNIIRAFHFDNSRRYQCVAVIDDIITSGSTMSEICKNLRNAGVKHIEVWSLTRALKND